MGGFQIYDEFMTGRALQKMPREISKEIREHIKKHRVEGGSTLRLVYVHDIEDFQLSEVYVQLDEIPIHIKRVQKKRRTTIYNGNISAGKHEFSFVFVLRSDNDMKKIDGKISVTVQEGTNFVMLKTTKIDSGKIVTEILQG